MKYTYDTNGLKNAMIYALQKAAKDAGFDKKILSLSLLMSRKPLVQ